MKPFKIDIPDEELDLLRRKLELARLPVKYENTEWGEDNGVTTKMMKETVDFWRNEYNWREEEAELNKLPQFITPIEMGQFGSLDIHCVHSTSDVKVSIPLLFLHGWPGSFAEVRKILPLLNDEGFHVVAPSLPGFGFSSHPEKAGFKHIQHAEVMHKLMIKLGYKQYVVQGGDWGSDIARIMGLLYPQSVRAVHQNMLMMLKPGPPFQEPEYTAFEKGCMERNRWFIDTNSNYEGIQSNKPRTLGFAMHDSPIGMLAWMADKLFLWSDDYPWTPTELITWTLLHYFPGPTTGFAMYNLNNPPDIVIPGSLSTMFLEAPCGFSVFPKELGIVPRSWAETLANVVFWIEHDRGGHFAAYEQPEAFAEDLIEFYKSLWQY